MRKSEFIFKVLGIASTVVFGVAGLVMEVKKLKTPVKISEDDKNDIAERVAKKIKNVRKVPQTKVEA